MQDVVRIQVLDTDEQGCVELSVFQMCDILIITLVTDPSRCQLAADDVLLLNEIQRAFRGNFKFIRLDFPVPTLEVFATEEEILDQLNSFILKKNQKVLIQYSQPA